MAGCWKILDVFYGHPLQFTEDLMAGISFFGKMEDPDDKLLEYYNIIQR
jgi:hypothetical protein